MLHRRKLIVATWILGAGVGWGVASAWDGASESRQQSPDQRRGPIVIAHRGASGYLPEHTLASAVLAHGFGADYLEPDVVLTRDGVPIVLHDIHLGGTTDVAEVFPKRRRGDGHFYALDFTLAEVKKLRVRERLGKDGKLKYAGRFPVAGLFTVPTLEEWLSLVAGLNKSRGREAGVYPEIKQPRFHRRAGFDISAIVLDVLAEAGYRERHQPIYIQCFDPVELRRIRHDLRSPLKLIQLLGADSDNFEEVDYGAMRSRAGLREIARYADGIGPWIADLYDFQSQESKGVAETAQELGLLVHGYTLRDDALPPGFTRDQAMNLVFGELGLDGVFTDFPDSALAYLKGSS